MNKDIYLLARYLAKPKNPKLTSQKGYMSNSENLEFDEQVYVVRGLKQKDLINQHVILNLTKEQVIKHQYNQSIEFTESFQYFYDGYGEYIDNSVNILNESISK